MAASYVCNRIVLPRDVVRVRKLITYGYFVTPARSLNTPRWVITRVLPGTDRGTFVMIVDGS